MAAFTVDLSGSRGVRIYTRVAAVIVLVGGIVESVQYWRRGGTAVDVAEPSTSRRSFLSIRLGTRPLKQIVAAALVGAVIGLLAAIRGGATWSTCCAFILSGTAFGLVAGGILALTEYDQRRLRRSSSSAVLSAMILIVVAVVSFSIFVMYFLH